MKKLLIVSITLLIGCSVYSQCTNNTQWPITTISASKYNDTLQISNDNYPGDYAIIDNLIIGETYVFISEEVGDYITIRDAYDSDVLLGHGFSPFIFSPMTRDIVAMHINLSSPPCGTNYIIRNTFVHCTTCPDLPDKVDVQNAFLEVEGAIQLGNLGVSPKAGMIKWNSESEDFEGYTGDKWVSLTKSNQTGQWGTPLTNKMGSDEILIAQNGSNGDNFGSAVSISGDYAIVGSESDEIEGNSRQGSAYIFFRSGSKWIQQAKLQADDGDAFEYFGSSVSISGDYAIVGNFGDLIEDNVDQGSAYIYHRSGTTWTEQAKILASDGSAHDRFGSAVSISGDYVVVGCVSSIYDQNSAYIFSRTGSSWTEQAIIDASDVTTEALFGNSVSISGDYIVVGSPLDDIGTNNNQGSAFVFHRTGSTWIEQAKLVASDGYPDDIFGNSVSISGDYVVVGSLEDDRFGITNQGSAYIFHRLGSSWTQQAKINGSDTSTNDYFGTSVSISGDYIVVGSQNDIESNNNQGCAYIFHRSGTTWTEQAKILANDGSDHDLFGNSVFISNDDIIIGCQDDDIQTNFDQGTAHVFSKK